jgi:phosphatidate cytidylyltransferase
MAIFNPGNSSLFMPTVYAFGGVLSAGLAGVVGAERGRISRIAKSTLFERWRTWAIIGPLFALAVLGGAAPLTGLVAIAAITGMLEYASVTGIGGMQRANLLASGVILVLTAAIAPQLMTAVLVVSLLRFAFAAMLDGERANLQSAALALLGLAYVPLLLGHALLINRNIEGGDGLLLALGVGAALSDVCAFTFGKLIGGRKLAPRLSPNKTWAGAAGNLVGAYAAIGLMWFALPAMPVWALALLPAIVAAAGVAGDLFESLIKRSFEVKDAGTWLPGFGGLLDRIDSLLFVLPAAYYFVATVS